MEIRYTSRKSEPYLFDDYNTSDPRYLGEASSDEEQARILQFAEEGGTTHVVAQNEGGGWVRFWADRMSPGS
jgi:hypothetical protein